MSCLNNHEMNDNSLLRVINPSIADREMRNELIASSVVLPVKLKTILKNPRGISSQIALKLNSKLGGINHVLASRLPPKVPGKKFLQQYLGSSKNRLC